MLDEIGSCQRLGWAWRDASLSFSCTGEQSMSLRLGLSFRGMRIYDQYLLNPIARSDIYDGGVYVVSGPQAGQTQRSSPIALGL
jgi:hypothetical protein